MIAAIERFRKEWHAIKAAPWSFVMVCLVAIGLIWGGFRYLFHDKLSDSDKLAAQWKSRSEYWQSEAEHPKSAANCQTQASASPTPTPSSELSTPKHFRAPKLLHNSTVTVPEIVSAPHGIAIGGGTVTNPTVNNNYGVPQRHLTDTQKQTLLSVLSANPDRSFEGVYALGQDNEGNIYAQDFFQIFKAAKWEIGTMVGQLLGTSVNDSAHPIPEGVWILVNKEDKDSPPASAESLFTALNSIGIRARGMTMNSVPKGKVQLLIGISDVKSSEQK